MSKSKKSDDRGSEREHGQIVQVEIIHPVESVQAGAKVVQLRNNMLMTDAPKGGVIFDNGSGKIVEVPRENIAAIIRSAPSREIISTAEVNRMRKALAQAEANKEELEKRLTAQGMAIEKQKEAVRERARKLEATRP